MSTTATRPVSLLSFVVAASIVEHLPQGTMPYNLYQLDSEARQAATVLWQQGQRAMVEQLPETFEPFTWAVIIAKS